MSLSLARTRSDIPEHGLFENNENALHGSITSEHLHDSEAGYFSKNGKEDPFEARWEEDDPENPYNWSLGKKSWCTFLLGMLALAGSAGSAIISPGSAAIAEQYHISQQVTVFSVSLYVTGFILGPSIWAPLSELYGRRCARAALVF